jgi:hypothetical protein
MNNTVSSPLSPDHDNRRACPHSHRLLREYINKGLAEFAPVVESMRIFKLQTDQRLIADFIKFRDVAAHKGFRDTAYLQMVCAFVNYCRDQLGLDDIAPATTRGLPKTFPRMADINVVICATWFFNITQEGSNVDMCRSIVKNLNRYKKNSSFDGYTFSLGQPDNHIIATQNGNEKQFDGNLLEEFANVLGTKLVYSPDEIKEFKESYRKARTLATRKDTHELVQRVLSSLEVSCTCPTRAVDEVDDLTDAMQKSSCIIY